MTEFDQIKAKVENHLNHHPYYYGVLTIDIKILDGEMDSFKVFPKEENIKFTKIKKP